MSFTLGLCDQATTNLHHRVRVDDVPGRPVFLRCFVELTSPKTLLPTVMNDSRTRMCTLLVCFHSLFSSADVVGQTCGHAPDFPCMFWRFWHHALGMLELRKDT